MESLLKDIKKQMLLTAYCFVPTAYFHGAGDGIRTRDPNLGKVVLYQLSYTRIFIEIRVRSLELKDE